MSATSALSDPGMRRIGAVEHRKWGKTVRVRLLDKIWTCDTSTNGTVNRVTACAPSTAH
jgi:hypothetical protein